MGINENTDIDKTVFLAALLKNLLLPEASIPQYLQNKMCKKTQTSYKKLLAQQVSNLTL